MAGRKSDFTLPTLDDLFSTQELRDDAKLSKIRDIPLELIDDFPDHPFKVRDDEDMIQLVESVKERGVITPATVRQKEDGRYELISGHRRKRACELAGFEALRCEVVDLDRDAATVLMVESNYQRSQILPSEKAFAYKMRLEAMKRQGQRSDLTLSPVGTKFDRSSEAITEETGDSRNQIHRYIRLTNLVQELLDLVDEGKIKMRPAVELSYLDEDSQRAVVDEIDLNQCTPVPQSDYPHLGGGFIGKGHAQDIARQNAQLIDQIGKAVRQCAGLAGACASQNQHRAFQRFRRQPLFLVQSVQIHFSLSSTCFIGVSD